jgi:hypothetical protein
MARWAMAIVARGESTESPIADRRIRKDSLVTVREKPWAASCVTMQGWLRTADVDRSCAGGLSARNLRGASGYDRRSQLHFK